MLNHITIMGRLTSSPEFRRTGNGIAVTAFTLAVDRDYCVAWRSTAEFVDKYFDRGQMAVVSGRLQIRDWEDKDGNKRRKAEVVADNVYFGEQKRDAGVNGAPSYGVKPAPASDFAVLEGEDEGLPF